MAVVEIFRRDENNLPEVCIVCGADCDGEPPARNCFWTTPAWVWFTCFINSVFGIVLALILMRFRRLNCPVCNEHSTYFLKRWWLGAGVVSSPFGLIFSMSLIADWPHRQTVAPYLMGCAIALWTLTIFVGYFSVKPLRIDSASIVLTHVSEEFARELDLLRLERYVRNVSPVPVDAAAWGLPACQPDARRS